MGLVRAGPGIYALRFRAGKPESYDDWLVLAIVGMFLTFGALTNTIPQAYLAASSLVAFRLRSYRRSE